MNVAGAANQTSLWSSLRDEVTLKKGAQAAISRYNNLHKHDNDVVVSTAKTQSLSPSSSSYGKHSCVAPNNQSTAAVAAATSDVTDNSKTDSSSSNDEDVREALKSAGFGFFMFTSASIIRKVIFKV